MSSSARALRPGPGVLAGAAGIAAAAAWTMGPALRGTWLWDDDLEVVRNPVVQAASGWWRAWLTPPGMDYLPLKDTALWLEWRAWAARPAGYHAVNLALHVLSALLIWRLLEVLIGQAAARGGEASARPPGAARFAAWLGALLFAVHPAAVASAAWIAEFKNALSLPLLLGAMLTLVEGGPSPGRKRTALALALFALSLLAKSSGVMFPAILLLYAWWHEGRLRRKDWIAALPFAALSLAAGAVTLWFQAHRAIGLGGPLPSLSWRLGQSGWTLAADLAACCGLGRFAPVYAPAGSSLPAVLPWLVLAGPLALGWRARAGWGRHFLFGLGWILLNLVPVLGALPMAYLRIAPRADQFLYLPLVGAVGLAAAAVYAGSLRLRALAVPARGALAGVLILAAGALAAKARAYAAAFRSPEALWTLAVRSDPGSWLARNNLGRLYLDQGRPEAAEPELREAVRLEPDSAEARANWGNALGALGRTGEAEAQLTEAVRLDPRLAGAAYDLGVLLERSGRNAEAAARFRQALAIDPGHAKAHNNLGLALFRLGQGAGAVAEYRAALRLDPRLPEAWLNLGNASMEAGRVEDAMAQYRRALALDPGYAAAHHNLAVALERLGRFAEARGELEAAEQPARK